MKCLWNNCNQNIEDVFTHLKIHLANETHTKCLWKDCKSIKPSKYKMIQHYLKHSKISLFKCNCGRNFARKIDMITHGKHCQPRFNRIVEELFSGLNVEIALLQ